MEKIMQNKKFIKIICLALATLLWMYVSYQENPSMSKTVRNVPIVIVGEQALRENGFSVYSVSEQSVNVKATAKRLALGRITNKTLSASINVSSIKKAGKHVIPVAVNSTSSSGTYYVKGKDITVTIEPIVTEKIKIENTTKTEFANDPTVHFDSTLTKGTVSVSAPKSIIDDIESVRTEPLVADKKIGSGSSTVRLVVYTKNGKILEGVECSPSEVTVNYVISDVKTVPIMLKTSDGKTHLLPDQYKVEIYGSSEAFNSVKYIETAEIDLSTYKAGDEVKLKLQLPDTVKSSKGINEIEIELYEDYFESDKVEEVE